MAPNSLYNKCQTLNLGIQNSLLPMVCVYLSIIKYLIVLPPAWSIVPNQTSLSF